MRFYRSGSMACISIGLILTLAIGVSGGTISYFIAKRLSRKAKNQLADIINHVIGMNFTLPSFHKDIVIASQAVPVQIDISKVVDPLKNFFAELPFPVDAPIINHTIETVVNTPQLVVPVDIDGISVSLLSLIGEELINSINSAPETIGDVLYYLLLAVGITLTVIACDAVLNKALMGGMGLWLKADIENNKDQPQNRRLSP